MVVMADSFLARDMKRGVLNRGVLNLICALAFVMLAGWSPANTAQAAPSAQAKEPSKEWMAWKLGREYAFATELSLIKESAQSQKSFGFARSFAEALGLAEPVLAEPRDFLVKVGAMAKELDAKHGEKARNHFLIGIFVTEAWFGTLLKSDVTQPVNYLASNLANSGIPESVWGSQLTAIKTKAASEDLENLARAIDEFLQR